jgi:predicted Zn-dependent protease
MRPGAVLFNEIDRPGWAAALVKFRPKTGFTRYWENRLFRRDPGIRFEGRIHETHVPSVRDYAARRSLEIGRADVAIDHFGYDGDQSRKHPRNLPLLLESIAANPSQPYCWCHLAETYAALGRDKEALETSERGLNIAGVSGDEKGAADVNLLAQTVARLRIEAGLDPSPVIEAALRRYPGDFAMIFIKARWLVTQGNAEEALPLLDQLLAIDPATLPPALLAFDEQIFGRRARELKAIALVKLGDAVSAAALMR